MILTRNKAMDLLHALEAYCKNKHIKMPKNKSSRYIALAKLVMNRYNNIVLVEGNDKYLCNCSKYLKKWTFLESLRKVSPMEFYNCDSLARRLQY